VVWADDDMDAPPTEPAYRAQQQAPPPPRYHPVPEDRAKVGKLQRGGPVNLHALTAFMVTEGRQDGSNRPPHYRGIIYKREAHWEALQWNGILRGVYRDKDAAITALLPTRAAA
jgi:hypothetical protein